MPRFIEGLQEMFQEPSQLQGLFAADLEWLL